MYNKGHAVVTRIVAIMLVIALVVPLSANAAVVEPIQPQASAYLSSYSAYVYPAGSGRIEVYFSVKGTDYMDEIGTLRIGIYESTNNSTWTWVKTYTHSEYSNLLAYDDFYHGSHVSYQGVAGRYYKAYICAWAGENGSGDTRYFWTSAQRAT